MERTNAMVTLFLTTLAASFAGGCGRMGYAPIAESSDAGANVDASMDATLDAPSMDATVDAGVDAAADGSTDVGVDASMDAGVDAGGPCTTWGPFGTPVRVSGLDLPDDEWAPCLSTDELTAYVQRFIGNADIYVATRPNTSSPFGTQTMVTELDTPSSESGPYLSPDGLLMLFSSDRPGGMGGADIWMATRPDTSSPFGTPTDVPGVETANNDHSPWLSDDRLRLYFTSSRATPDNIYVASRPDTTSPFGAAVLISELSSPYDERGICLSHDELEMVFDSDRPGGMGDQDLYIAHRTSRDLPFDPPVPITELNTPYDDLAPWLSADGTRLYMNRDTLTSGGRNADIWVATRSCM